MYSINCQVYFGSSVTPGSSPPWLLVPRLTGRASYVTGASWVVDGGMLRMGSQTVSLVQDDAFQSG